MKLDLKMRWLKKKYTFMIIPEAKGSVIHLRFHASLLLALPLLLLALVLGALAVYGITIVTAKANTDLHQKLLGQNSEFQTAISEKNNTIEHLENEVLDLSRQADHIKTKMEEIRKLGEEMKDLTGLNPKIDGSPAALVNADKPGLGGNSRPVTDQDIDNLIDRTRKSYGEYADLMNTLNGDLSVTKERVLEHKHERDITPSIWPVDTRAITSGFGLRRDPFNGSLLFHSGLDFGAPANSPVYAAAEGTVASVGSDSSHGNNIVINHTNGYKTWYMHMNEFKVKQGDSVKKGQEIGLVGSTGRSTGPHLHYEVIKNGSSVDPYPYLISSRKDD